MSVLAQVKKFSEDPETPDYDRAYLSGQGTDDAAGSDMEEMMQATPIPGQSLTNDPETPGPHERPPQFTEQREFIDHLFIQMTKEEVLPDLLSAMQNKLPIEDLALKVLKGQLRKGNINTDMILLCIEPTIYMLIAFATFAEIEAVLYPEGDDDEEASKEDMVSKFKEASRRLRGEGTEDDKPGLTVGDLQAPTVLPQGLMKRTQAAVKGNTGNTGE